MVTDLISSFDKGVAACPATGYTNNASVQAGFVIPGIGNLPERTCASRAASTVKFDNGTVGA
jgi:hypothetical protein